MAITEVLDASSTVAHETAPVGGFPIAGAVEVVPVTEPTIGSVPPEPSVLVPRPPKYTSEEIAAAQATLRVVEAEEGFNERYRRGLNDVTSRDEGRQRSPDAQFYAAYEGLLERAYSAHDHYPGQSGPSEGQAG